MKTEVAVKQVEGATVTVEVLATSIQAIADGMKRLLAGKLNEKALILLIQHAAPQVGRFPPKPISQKEIKAVLHGIASLQREYLK